MVPQRKVIRPISFRSNRIAPRSMVRSPFMAPGGVLPSRRIKPRIGARIRPAPIFVNRAYAPSYNRAVLRRLRKRKIHRRRGKIRKPRKARMGAVFQPQTFYSPVVTPKDVINPPSFSQPPQKRSDERESDIQPNPIDRPGNKIESKNNDGSEIETSIRKIPVLISKKCYNFFIKKITKFRKCFKKFCIKRKSCETACFGNHNKSQCEEFRSMFMGVLIKSPKIRAKCCVGCREIYGFSKYVKRMMADRSLIRKNFYYLTHNQVIYIKKKIKEIATNSNKILIRDFMIKDGEYARIVFDLKENGHSMTKKDFVRAKEDLLKIAIQRIKIAVKLKKFLKPSDLLRLIRYIIGLNRQLNCPLCKSGNIDSVYSLPDFDLKVHGYGSPPKYGDLVAKLIRLTLEITPEKYRTIVLSIIRSRIKVVKIELNLKYTKTSTIKSILIRNIFKENEKSKSNDSQLEKSIDPDTFEKIHKNISEIEKIVRNTSEVKITTIFSYNIEKPIKRLISATSNSLELPLRKYFMSIIRFKIERIKLLFILKILDNKVPIKIRVKLLNQVIAYTKEEKILLIKIRRRMKKKNFLEFFKRLNLIEKVLKLSKKLRPKIPTNIRNIVQKNVNRVIMRKIKMVPLKVRSLVRNIINVRIRLEKHKKMSQNNLKMSLKDNLALADKIKQDELKKAELMKILRSKVDSKNIGKIEKKISEVGNDKVISQDIGSRGINVDKVQKAVIGNIFSKVKNITSTDELNIKKLVLSKIEGIILTRELKRTYSNTPISLRLSAAKDLEKNKQEQKRIMILIKKTLSVAQYKIIVQQIEIMIRRLRRRKIKAKKVGLEAKLELKSDINKVINKVPRNLKEDVRKVIDAKIEKVKVQSKIDQVKKFDPEKVKSDLRNKLDDLKSKQKQPLANLAAKVGPENLAAIKDTLSKINEAIVLRNAGKPISPSILPSVASLVSSSTLSATSSSTTASSLISPSAAISSATSYPSTSSPTSTLTIQSAIASTTLLPGIGEKINQTIANIKKTQPNLSNKIIRNLIKQQIIVNKLQKEKARLGRIDPKKAVSKINNKLDKVRRNQRNILDDLSHKLKPNQLSGISAKIAKIADLIKQKAITSKDSNQKINKKTRKTVRSIISSLPKNSREDAKQLIKNSLNRGFLEAKLNRLNGLDPKTLADKIQIKISKVTQNKNQSLLLINNSVDPKLAAKIPAKIDKIAKLIVKKDTQSAVSNKLKRKAKNLIKKIFKSSPLNISKDIKAAIKALVKVYNNERKLKKIQTRNPKLTIERITKKLSKVTEKINTLSDNLKKNISPNVLDILLGQATKVANDLINSGNKSKINSNQTNDQLHKRFNNDFKKIIDQVPDSSKNDMAKLVDAIIKKIRLEKLLNSLNKYDPVNLASKIKDKISKFDALYKNHLGNIQRATDPETFSKIVPKIERAARLLSDKDGVDYLKKPGFKLYYRYKIRNFFKNLTKNFSPKVKKTIINAIKSQVILDKLNKKLDKINKMDPEKIKTRLSIKLEKVIAKEKAALDKLRKKVDPNSLDKIIPKIDGLYNSARNAPKHVSITKPEINRSIKKIIKDILKNSPSEAKKDIKKLIKGQIKMEKLKSNLKKIKTLDLNDASKKLQRKIIRSINTQNKLFAKVKEQVGPKKLKNLINQVRLVSKLPSKPITIIGPNIPKNKLLDRRIKSLVKNLLTSLPESAKRDVARIIKLESKKANLAAEIKKVNNLNIDKIKSDLNSKLRKLDKTQSSALANLNSIAGSKLVKHIASNINDIVSKNKGLINQPNFNIPKTRGDISTKLNNAINNTISSFPKPSRNYIKKAISLEIEKSKLLADLKKTINTNPKKTLYKIRKSLDIINRSKDKAFKSLKSKTDPQDLKKIKKDLNKIKKLLNRISKSSNLSNNHVVTPLGPNLNKKIKRIIKDAPQDSKFAIKKIIKDTIIKSKLEARIEKLDKLKLKATGDRLKDKVLNLIDKQNASLANIRKNLSPYLSKKLENEFNLHRKLVNDMASTEKKNRRLERLIKDRNVIKKIKDISKNVPEKIKHQIIALIKRSSKIAKLKQKAEKLDNISKSRILSKLKNKLSKVDARISEAKSELKNSMSPEKYGKLSNHIDKFSYDVKSKSIADSKHNLGSLSNLNNKIKTSIKKILRNSPLEERPKIKLLIKGIAKKSKLLSELEKLSKFDKKKAQAKLFKKIERLDAKIRASVEKLGFLLSPSTASYLNRKLSKIEKLISKSINRKLNNLVSGNPINRNIISKSNNLIIKNFIENSPPRSRSEIKKIIKLQIKKAKALSKLINLNNSNLMKLQFKIVGKIDSINKKQKQIISQIRNPEIVSGLDNVKKLVDIKNSSRYHKIRESKPALIKELKNIIKRVVQSSTKEVKRDIKKVIGLEVSKIKLLDKLSNAQRFRKDRITSQLRDQISTVSHKFDQIKHKLKNKLDPLNFANVIKKLNKISSLAKSRFDLPIKPCLFDPSTQRQINKHIRDLIKMTHYDARNLIRKIIKSMLDRLKLESQFRNSKLISGSKMTELVLNISKHVRLEKKLIFELKNLVRPSDFEKILLYLAKISKAILSPVSTFTTVPGDKNEISNIENIFKLYIKNKILSINLSNKIRNLSFGASSITLGRLFSRLKFSISRYRKYSHILKDIYENSIEQPLSNKSKLIKQILEDHFYLSTFNHSYHRLHHKPYHNVFIRKSLSFVKRCGVKDCCRNCCQTCYEKVFGRSPRNF
ncbi:hypothetical protein AYI68_g583 [Smittium mucronatum]|uniref:Uncharacterized protein n=1 Tax=Smittium mucronatum TaxID=133383 RepID=A0A1R0H800_9FUNG|nr:hypothetical protein AYI68_g583 [Smittium mucronatum]